MNYTSTHSLSLSLTLSLSLLTHSLTHSLTQSTTRSLHLLAVAWPETPRAPYDPDYDNSVARSLGVQTEGMGVRQPYQSALRASKNKESFGQGGQRALALKLERAALAARGEVSEVWWQRHNELWKAVQKHLKVNITVTRS